MVLRAELVSRLFQRLGPVSRVGLLYQTTTEKMTGRTIKYPSVLVRHPAGRVMSCGLVLCSSLVLCGGLLSCVGCATSPVSSVHAERSLSQAGSPWLPERPSPTQLAPTQLATAQPAPTQLAPAQPATAPQDAGRPHTAQQFTGPSNDDEPTLQVDFVDVQSTSNDLITTELITTELPAAPWIESEVDDNEITLEALQSQATTEHPAIESAAAQLAALNGKWVQAGLPPNPVAQYNSDEIFNDDASGLHQFAIGQTYVTANKLSLAQCVVAEQIQAAHAQVETARLRVQTNVRSSFLSALVAQQRLELVDQLLQIAEKSVQSVDAMVRAEEVSRIALLQAQTEYQQAMLERETAASNLDAARRKLASDVGIDSLSGGPLAGSPEDLFEDTSEAFVFETLQSKMTSLSPEVARRAAQIQQAQRSLQLAVAQVTPNVTTQIGVGFDASTDDTYTSIQVSMPLPIRNRNQGNIRQARSQISVAGARLRQTELDLSKRLTAAFRDYQNATIRRDRLRSEIIPRAEEMLTLAVQSFEAGESSYLELLTVQRTLFQSRLRELDAVAAVAQAANQIDGFLLGG
tara:strand:+ start:96 stop:1823 length:1728 start_codon:yes stop_codon:yes gene_type:complete